MKKLILKYNLIIALVVFMFVGMLYYGNVIHSTGGYISVILITLLYSLSEQIKRKSK